VNNYTTNFTKNVNQVKWSVIFALTMDSMGEEINEINGEK
jgi:hypothetical protein